MREPSGVASVAKEEKQGMQQLHTVFEKTRGNPFSRSSRGGGVTRPRPTNGRLGDCPARVASTLLRDGPASNLFSASQSSWFSACRLRRRLKGLRG